MLQIFNLSYSIGGKDLLSDVTWSVRQGRRVALVGANGVGKTTLLRIIHGDIEVSRGRVVKPRGFRIGYLQQEEIASGEGSALANVLEGKQEIHSLEKSIEALHKELDSGGNEDRLNRLGQMEQRYQALGGYTVEAAAKKILSGLGFVETDWVRPAAELSGGWRMRVHLARLLLEEPDLLLLDEPTNHLDLPSLEWLEQYLLQFPGSVVLVSHDRFSIDRLAHEIFELERGQLLRYPGNYHAYERRKQQRVELQRKRWAEQRTERERQEKFISRYRYDKKRAAQVQSRIRMLEKMEDIEQPPPVPRLDFSLGVAEPSYKDVLTAETVSFGYGEDWVFNDFNLHISRGERVAMVGVNGSGKTTLARLMAGQLQPRQGTVRLGKRTVIGYYAQHQIEALNPDATVYDEVSSTVAVNLVPRIRGVLGLFQFHEDDVFKKVRVLSGGEKARVSLAKILLSSANFLIMDEPTTHLDIAAREALEQALAGYEGTLLLISHDRYFLDKLVRRVVEIREGRVIEYVGNYSDYIDKRGREPVPVTDEGPPPAVGQPASVSRKSREQKRLEAEARQAVSRERSVIQERIASLEVEIEKLETRKKDLGSRISHPETYKENGHTIGRMHKEYAALQRNLNILYEDWERFRAQLDELLAGLSGPGRS